MEQFEQKKETVITACFYIKRFIEGVKKTVQLFRQGDEKEGLNYIKDVLEGMQWIYDALRLTKDIHTHTIECEQLYPFLEEMASALDNKDYVLLSDLLEYEIMPILYQWASTLEQMVKSDFKEN